MIGRIEELNRVLLSAKTLIDKNKSIEEDILIEYCQQVLIEARMPDHTLTIHFCENIGLLTRKKNKLSLTEQCKLFLELNPKSLYELSDEQKRFIIRNCYLSGNLQRQTRACLKSFSPDYKKKTYRWSSYDSPALNIEEWIPEHLRQLGILKRISNGFEVQKKYVETVVTFLAEKKGWTEEQFKEYLKEKKELGDLAEKLILEFEINRLRKLKCFPEAGCVRIISKLKTGEGYDIDSFDKKSPGMKYDRFIEVKGSGKSAVRFIWSPNEIEVAKKLGNNYWIYYQGGIIKKNGTAKNKPLLFQNPIKTIMKNSNFTQTHNGIIIEANLTGELVG